MQQRLPSLLDPPLAFAHRGARAHAADNTIESFQLALRLGAPGLESDVWLTADDVAVLDHDGVVRRGLRRVPISRLNRAELPEHIPTLTELFAACGTDWDLSLDVKDPAAAPAIVDVVGAADPSMLGRTWLCDPSFDRCVRYRNDFDHVRIINSTRLKRIDEGVERRAARLAENGIDGINLHFSDWNGGLVSLFHRFDRMAFGWDLQHDHQLDAAFRMGLDAVFSDHTDVMVAVLDRVTA